MQELLDLALKRIENLEKLVDRYFRILKIDNELDFIIKGTYLKAEDIVAITEGKY